MSGNENNEAKKEASSPHEENPVADAAKGDVHSDSSDHGGGNEDSEEEDGFFEMLRRKFMEKFNLTDDEKICSVLDEVSIDGVVKYIESGKCKNIITMAGAGISTAAGIPDFRSPNSGLYHNMQKYDLPHPEAIFDIGFFKKNPKPFFALAKELFPGSFNPTLSHYFIKLLHQKGLLVRHYTQNIDTLEHVVGVPEDKIVEAHGTFRVSHCLQCDREFDLQWMKEQIFSRDCVNCPDCNGLVKPDIIFFGESLPARFFQLISKDFKDCDLLFVLGTSLTVQPFASLVDTVGRSCPRVLINREEVGGGGMGRLFGEGGMDFKHRDVAVIGDCDEGCRTLVEKLGWKDDLTALMNEKKGGGSEGNSTDEAKL